MFLRGQSHGPQGCFGDVSRIPSTDAATAGGVPVGPRGDPRPRPCACRGGKRARRWSAGPRQAISTCTSTTTRGTMRSSRHEDGIPDAVLSADRTTRGSESFTDSLDPSTRPFGYRVCYFDSSSARPPATPIVMRWIDESGVAHAESFTLGAPDDCRDFGAVALIAPDGDGDARGRRGRQLRRRPEHRPGRCGRRRDRTVAHRRLRRGDVCTATDPTRHQIDSAERPATPASDSERPPPPRPRRRRAPSPPCRRHGKTRRGRRGVGHGARQAPQRQVPDARRERVDPAWQHGRRDEGQGAADAAAGPGGASRRALFYRGVFMVTQTRGPRSRSRSWR